MLQNLLFAKMIFQLTIFRILAFNVFMNEALNISSSQGNQVGPTCSSEWIKSSESPPPLDSLPNLFSKPTYSPRVSRWLTSHSVMA
ncbi:hypothetical protein VNO77_06234 [Canavalia gladiata]|uniref:Secreted protein n=1 Tax=Canavalia gladiata TaxID=3824 RepID=A0AAN9M6E7_CANGL